MCVENKSFPFLLWCVTDIVRTSHTPNHFCWGIPDGRVQEKAKVDEFLLCGRMGVRWRWVLDTTCICVKYMVKSCWKNPFIFEWGSTLSMPSEPTRCPLLGLTGFRQIWVVPLGILGTVVRSSCPSIPSCRVRSVWLSLHRAKFMSSDHQKIHISEKWGITRFNADEFEDMVSEKQLISDSITYIPRSGPLDKL